MKRCPNCGAMNLLMKDKIFICWYCTEKIKLEDEKVVVVSYSGGMEGGDCNADF